MVMPYGANCGKLRSLQRYIFWWRAVNNFLPTKKELKMRHVEKEDFCDTCGAEGENLFHVAFECSLARSFWQTAKDLIGIKNTSHAFKYMDQGPSDSRTVPNS